MSQDHIIESIPAYVLGCLDGDEFQAVNRHLMDCAVCQEEMRRYQKVVDRLPLGAKECDPPQELRQKILSSAVGADIQKRMSPGRQPWYMRVFGLRQPALGALAVLLLVILTAANVYQFAEIQTLKQEKVANPFRYVNMVGTSATPGAIGLIIISADQRTATLVVDGLPALPEKQEYQLWLIQDGRRVSGGVFKVIDTGFGALLVNSPKPIHEFQAFGITVEPAGGSPGPTGQKVLGGNF